MNLHLKSNLHYDLLLHFLMTFILNFIVLLNSDCTRIYLLMNLNSSTLGKEFSVNVLTTRFADISTASREDLQPVSSVPVPAKEAICPSQENKQQATVKRYSGNDSPIDSLLSVLTSELDGHNATSLCRKKEEEKRKNRKQVLKNNYSN